MRRAIKRLASRNGKAHIPPRAMKLPAAYGDQRNVGSEAPKTGRLASQAPRMKKQLIENQHIQITTPHCGRDMMCVILGEGDGEAASV